jgi:hypothetical protein
VISWQCHIYKAPRLRVRGFHTVICLSTFVLSAFTTDNMGYTNNQSMGDTWEVMCSGLLQVCAKGARGGGPPVAATMRVSSISPQHVP